MIRTLYANGCSFTEGRELEEEEPEMLVLAKSRDMASQPRVGAYRKSLSWPSHLGKEFTSHTKHLLRFVRPGAHKSVQAVGNGEMEYKSGYSFEEWLIFSGAPRALGQHPSAEAHRFWAGLLHNDMKANGIL